MERVKEEEEEKERARGSIYKHILRESPWRVRMKANESQVKRREETSAESRYRSSDQLKACLLQILFHFPLLHLSLSLYLPLIPIRILILTHRELSRAFFRYLLAKKQALASARTTTATTMNWRHWKASSSSISVLSISLSIASGPLFDLSSFLYFFISF